MNIEYDFFFSKEKYFYSCINKRILSCRPHHFTLFFLSSELTFFFFLKDNFRHNFLVSPRSCYLYRSISHSYNNKYYCFLFWLFSPAVILLPLTEKSFKLLKLSPSSQLVFSPITVSLTETYYILWTKYCSFTIQPKKLFKIIV